MNSNGILRKHWFHVSLHFVSDAVLFYLAFVVAILLRFGDEANDSFGTYWPTLVLAASFFPR